MFEDRIKQLGKKFSDVRKEQEALSIEFNNLIKEVSELDSDSYEETWELIFKHIAYQKHGIVEDDEFWLASNHCW